MESGARGSGRTYRILSQMFDTIIQNPDYKRIYFFSPTHHITKYCMRMFIREFLQGRGVNDDFWNIINGDIVFANGTKVIFETIKSPIVSQESLYRIDKLKGLDNYLIFEDHTLYESYYSGR